MPIAFNCSCGKMLRVPDTSAGKRAKCPACGAVVEVPAPDPVFEVVEEPPPQPRVGGARHGEAPVAKPAADDDDDSDDGSTYKLADGSGGGRSRKADDDDSDDGSSATEQPKKKLPNFRKGRDRHK